MFMEVTARGHATKIRTEKHPVDLLAVKTLVTSSRAGGRAAGWVQNQAVSQQTAQPRHSAWPSRIADCVQRGKV